MSASAPWSVKGIDPKAREVAKDAARRSGMTLGEWLNAVIIQGEPEGEDEVDTAAVDLAARRKRALRGSVYGGPERTEDDVARLSRAVEALGDRVQAAEARAGTAETASALTIGGLTDRLERADDDRRLLLGRIEALSARVVEAEQRSAGQLAALRDEAAAALRIGGPGLSEDGARAIAALAGRVEAAERRSALAVERMGHEILRVAENLHGRMTTLERTGVEAARAGREAAEAARAGLDVAEARLRRIEDGQEQLIDRLSSDVARLTERLSERLEGVERRAALAVDDLGERIERKQSKLESRYERLAGEFESRIRASEERTRLLLDEARATLDRAALDAQARVEAAAPHEEIAPLSEEPVEFAPAFEADAPLVFQDLKPEPRSFDALAFAPEPDAAQPPEFVTVRRPVLAAVASDAASEPAFRPVEDEAPAAETTVRDAVAQGRAAARRAQRETAKAEEFALGSLRLRRGGRLQDVSSPKKRGSGMLAKAALASATAVTVVSAVTGWSAIFAGEEKPGDSIAMSLTETAPSPEREARLAVAYAEAIGKLNAGDATGVQALTAVAEQGHAPAQFHLGKLYETGEGVARNDGEARRWTERAARGGDMRAMYNLGHYWFEGVGGEKDAGTASVWFRKAAKAGLADSQFNLGRLYEQGYGVPLNPAAAYEWYLIAARSGDPEAAAAAERMRPTLTPDKLARAERAAAEFKAEPVERAG